MPACLQIPRCLADLVAGGTQAYRSVPDEDADADPDDWEAVDPDPAELEEWDEPLQDESFDDDFDEDVDDWDDADNWPDFDPSDDDEDD